MSATNGTSLPIRKAENGQKPLRRAEETEELLSAVQSLIIPFIKSADDNAATQPSGHGLQVPGKGPRSVLVEHHAPKKLTSLLSLDLPSTGAGKDGLLAIVETLLQYSVNTWDQGFLSKLYASTTPVGVAADLVLSALNTNLHVYQVSPALTIIEKTVSRALAEKFGLKGPFAGGVSQPGGSAANLSSIVIARNSLFPETKTEGYGTRKFVLFTSAHGHYSLEKAAQICGFGSNAVRSVAVDERGCMSISALQAAVTKARESGETPFYVNATAGTTVLGSFDPLDDIAAVCKTENLWLHVDGSWGGPVIFCEAQKHKLKGVELADSIALCPHKMLGIPVTCTFLLGRDLRQFHAAMTLPAGYLFHSDEDEDPSPADTETTNGTTSTKQQDFNDLADLTPQCGRRGDSLKMALTWIYQGSAGFDAYISTGFAAAAHLADLVAGHEDFSLVSENPPPCLQVCFYYRKGDSREANSKRTAGIAAKLVPRGFMVDFAPGEEGSFLRVVVNGQTTVGTVEGLVKAIEEVGGDA